MTDEIARELQDMHAHPWQTLLALVTTLLIMFGCVAACVSPLFFALKGAL